MTDKAHVTFHNDHRRLNLAEIAEFFVENLGVKFTPEVVHLPRTGGLRVTIRENGNQLRTYFLADKDQIHCTKKEDAHGFRVFPHVSQN